jgi:hypothetical protein
MWVVEGQVDGQGPIILSDEITATPALVRAGVDALPAAIIASGERSPRRFIEFFTATIRNRNIRTSCARAVKQFFGWCEDHHLDLDDIEPIAIAAYIEHLASGWRSRRRSNIWPRSASCSITW